MLVIPTMNQGGAERVMSVLANQFSKNEELEVHLVLLAKSKDFYQIDKNVIIHRLGFENTSKLPKIISEFKIFIKLRKLFFKHRPKVTLSFMEKYNILTILASLFLDIENYISDRRNPLNKLPKNILFLRFLTYRHASGVIAQTTLAKNYILQNKLNSNVKVIPNPIRIIKENTLLQKEKIILSVGRLIPEKGHKYLIEAFSKIKRIEWKLIILGDGPLKDDIEAQISKLNLIDRVTLQGEVTNVDEWLNRASIFAFPSLTEGFPNALAEAMSAGLPCVSFDCDAGPRDIIKKNENGYLIPPKDIESLTKILDELCINPGLRKKIGRESKKVQNTLNVDQISKEFLDFLKY